MRQEPGSSTWRVSHKGQGREVLAVARVAAGRGRGPRRVR